jgi:hypothetical protein
MAGSSNPDAPRAVPRKKQGIEDREQRTENRGQRTEDREQDNRITGNQGAGYQESGDQDYS